MSELIKAGLTPDRAYFLARGGRPLIRKEGPQNGSVEYFLPPRGASLLNPGRRVDGTLVFTTRDGKEKKARTIRVPSGLAPLLEQARDEALIDANRKPIH